MVLPDTGGLVLALVAHVRFLVGLLVVEKEFAAAAVRSARGAAGRSMDGAAEDGPGMALAPLDMGQFFTVRGSAKLVGLGAGNARQRRLLVSCQPQLMRVEHTRAKHACKRRASAFGQHPDALHPDALHGATRQVVLTGCNHQT